MELKDQVALVTGAASGLGKAIAQRFARAGARIVVADLDRGAAAAAATEIDARPGRAIGVAMDVTDEAAVNAGVAEAISTFGTVDILVSNAGIQIVHPIEDFTYAEWKKMLAIHLDGAFLTTRACVPHMYKAGRGSLIYMGSVHSKEASLLKAPYVTAKHGLIGLAKTMAKEGARHGVRANVICPGFVRTPLVEKQIPEQAKVLNISEDDVIRKVMLKDTVDGEFTTLDDVAEVALLFASFPSNALTGQSLVVSHGWFMQCAGASRVQRTRRPRRRGLRCSSSAWAISAGRQPPRASSASSCRAPGFAGNGGSTRPASATGTSASRRTIGRSCTREGGVTTFRCSGRARSAATISPVSAGYSRWISTTCAS